MNFTNIGWNVYAVQPPLLVHGLQQRGQAKAHPVRAAADPGVSHRQSLHSPDGGPGEIPQHMQALHPQREGREHVLYDRQVFRNDKVGRLLHVTFSFNPKLLPSSSMTFLLFS